MEPPDCQNGGVSRLTRLWADGSYGASWDGNTASTTITPMIAIGMIG